MYFQAPSSPSLDPFFFFNDTATTEIYPLSLHDALPIFRRAAARAGHRLAPGFGQGERHGTDRKSTRLNSSHSQISYAVFCLKKKKNWGSALGIPVCGDTPR